MIVLNIQIKEFINDQTIKIFLSKFKIGAVPQITQQEHKNLNQFRSKCRVR